MHVACTPCILHVLYIILLSCRISDVAESPAACTGSRVETGNDCATGPSRCTAWSLWERSAVALPCPLQADLAEFCLCRPSAGARCTLYCVQVFAIHWLRNDNFRFDQQCVDTPSVTDLFRYGAKQTPKRRCLSCSITLSTIPLPDLLASCPAAESVWLVMLAVLRVRRAARAAL